ncbi:MULTISPECIES: MaoC family dehydratase N-terminal domain-containing protein [Rhodobacterales]|jgi:acyl dehydratase|uniref:Acyl dehydratase n=1 Tax=Pontivivens nitratireducens TaxID=2758038 RepID=A0A6G7VRW9_9RHOB|nr:MULTISPECIES: MaoC family dehydratase N-terminal domain-containing protein [Rhodobacterales]MCD1628192.1 MaoC family dehydratase N-terminal domain-containing protein [Seohaeicola saemankumensis]QIK42527.1 acyl dehydratase [Pontibrevibacter nitratireducens]
METLGLGLFFEDVTVGRTFKTIGRTISEADIINFVTCTGMTEVLFTNSVFQEEESLIKGRVVPSALVYTFMEGLLVQSTMQHTGFAFLEMSYKVGGPTVAGDTIHCEVEIVEARRSKKRPDKGIVTSHNRVINQRGELVLDYKPTRMVNARTKGE